MRTKEKFKWILDWLKENKPESTLIPIYELAIQKDAVITLDSMWRLYLNGQTYSANRVWEFYDILTKGDTDAGCI